MKITKRQLKRIIREEKRRLVSETMKDDYAEMGNFREPGAQEQAVIAENLATVRDAILELFVMNGEVRTTDVFEHLQMSGMHQDEIDIGLDALGDEY